jgi:hypothetical protein
MRLRPLIFISVMIPMSIGMLFVMVYLFGDLDNLPVVLERTRWYFFIPVPFLLPLFYLLHATRISVALRSIDAPMPPKVALATCILSGNMVNAIVPGMGGELVQAYFLKRFFHVPMPAVLASSAYTKVVGLATNVCLAMVGIWLMPADKGQDSSGIFTLSLLLKVSLGGLLAALTVGLVFPGVVRWGASLMRRVFRTTDGATNPSRFRSLAAKAADGLERTAGLFSTLRTAGPMTTLKVIGVTLLINSVFSTCMLLGFLAVGYTPALYLLFLFYSMLTIVLVSAMIILAGIAATELAALAFWVHLTGLSASEVLVAMLAVKTWQIFEMATAMVLTFRFLSHLSKDEIKSLLLRRQTPKTE